MFSFWHTFFLCCAFIFRMKLKSSFIIVALFLCGSFAFGQKNYHLKKSLWKNEMYNSYNHNSILKYQPIYATINPRAVDIPFLNALIFFETNRQRALNGLPLLKYSSQLENSANGHSTDMSNLNFFSHKSKVKGKECFSDRIKLEGFDYRYCAENIIFYYMMPLDDVLFSPTDEDFVFCDENGDVIEYYTYIGLARAIVNNWMLSEGHKENILDDSSEYLGVGSCVYMKTEGKKFKVPYIYSTQNFATPKK